MVDSFGYDRFHRILGILQNGSKILKKSNNKKKFKVGQICESLSLLVREAISKREYKGIEDISIEFE